MYIGVDFGTVFSQTAVFHNKNSLRLLSSGTYGTPSLFYYDSVQDIIVGDEANDAAQGIFADNIVRDVKMKIDQCFNLDGRTFSAEEIIKSIYEEVLEHASEEGKEQINDPQIKGIVVCHPAKFSMTEISVLTRSASTCLGKTPIKILGRIKEPVAAALAYYHNNPERPESGKGILVYDLGGGTCDIALVCADSNELAEYTVLDSDTVRVGGRNWDKVLFDYVIDKAEESRVERRDILNSQANQNEILKAVIKAKEDLSKRAEVKIRVNLDLEGKAKLLEIPISRETFNEMTVELLDETISKLEKIYNRHCGKIEIEEIICVGGASNMPQVREALEDRFGDCEIILHIPEYAIADGAAIYAKKIVDKVESLGYNVDEVEDFESIVNPSKCYANGVVLPSCESVTGVMLSSNHTSQHSRGLIEDILPLSYGVRCQKKDSNEYVVQNLLKKGDSLPVTAKFGGLAPADNGKDIKAIEIEICESECTDDRFACDMGKGERVIGTISLYKPDGVSADDDIECTLTISCLDYIKAEARDNKGSKIEVEVNLNGFTCSHNE